MENNLNENIQKLREDIEVLRTEIQSLFADQSNELNGEKENIKRLIEEKNEDLINMQEKLDQYVKKQEEQEKRKLKLKMGALKVISYVLISGAVINLVMLGSKKCNGKKVDTKTDTNGSDKKIEQTMEAMPSSTPIVTPDSTEKPFESYGNFTDASNPKALEERTSYYFDNYFNKLYDKNTLEKAISKEELIDILSVLNGKLPVEGDFNVNDILKYSDDVVNTFISYASTKEDEENNTRKFIPMAPLFEDGSYEQKCLQETDDVMKPLIKAMNEENNEDFEKYAIMFGELMRDKYYLVDQTSEHYGVRSRAAFASRIHLYAIDYAQYASNVYEYGVKKGIDVCIPFCFNGSNEIEMIPLSKLMATLEFVPMGQWDAVLKRAGITVNEIVSLGNASVEDTMPVVFTKDAKNHFRELQNQKVLR